MFKRNRAKFNVGDYIFVQDIDKISKTLDSENKLQGCSFTKQMMQHCNQKYKILITVNKIFYKKMYRSRSTFYLLDDVFCNGDMEFSNQKCDRSCYILWHENWLEKA